MADKEKYVIKIQGKLIEVSQDVYYAYFQMERQERGQEEKKQRNEVLSYDALDDGETVGLEKITDMATPSMEEMAITSELRDRLHHAVAALPKAERELIRAIYFDGMTEEEFAKAAGMSQTGISYHRRKTLSKLKMFLGIIPFMSLDLTPGAGNLLDEFYWEILSPWRGESLILNTGPAPRSGAAGSTSWSILEEHPHPRYFLTRKACLGILRRASEREKPLPEQLRIALEIQSGLRVGKGEKALFEDEQSDESIDLDDMPLAFAAN